MKLDYCSKRTGDVTWTLTDLLLRTDTSACLFLRPPRRTLLSPQKRAAPAGQYAGAPIFTVSLRIPAGIGDTQDL